MPEFFYGLRIVFFFLGATSMLLFGGWLINKVLKHSRKHELKQVKEKFKTVREEAKSLDNVDEKKLREQSDKVKDQIQLSKEL